MIAMAVCNLVTNCGVQNPKDCKIARKLVCNINKGCGFGCQLHHLTYCFLVAYGTNRTLIVSSHGWRYSPSGGWEKYFLPVSETCVDRSGSSRPWSGGSITLFPYKWYY